MPIFPSSLFQALFWTILVWNLIISVANDECQGRLALVTGATGSTGRLVTQLLLEQGYCVRALTRNVEKGRLKLNDRVELVEGDLGDPSAVEAAFDSNDDVSHVVFCAGGEEADWDAVNHRGVIACAEQSAKHKVQSMVVISAAWVSKPYSIASLLFNSLYATKPMALHLQGEERMKEILEKTNTNYVIVRAGRLVPDEEYPKEAAKGVWINQGDGFSFFGPAGAPGMCHSQLAKSVVAALGIQGKYTVEITSGAADPENPTVYESLFQDKGSALLESDAIMQVHSAAVQDLQTLGIALGVIFLVSVWKFGWKQTMVLMLAIDILFVYIYTKWISDLSVADCLWRSGSSATGSSGSEL